MLVWELEDASRRRFQVVLVIHVERGVVLGSQPFDLIAIEKGHGVFFCFVVVRSVPQRF